VVEGGALEAAVRAGALRRLRPVVPHLGNCPFSLGSKLADCRAVRRQRHRRIATPVRLRGPTVLPCYRNPVANEFLAATGRDYGPTLRTRYRAGRARKRKATSVSASSAVRTFLSLAASSEPTIFSVLRPPPCLLRGQASRSPLQRRLSPRRRTPCGSAARAPARRIGRSPPANDRHPRRLDRSPVFRRRRRRNRFIEYADIAVALGSAFVEHLTVHSRTSA
jgi:hypothetical protein